jgi:hypothetical protein
VPGELFVGEPLPDDLRYGQVETLRIVQPTLVKPKCLFVDVAVKMKRFNGNVRAVNAALQERPEVLAAVRMNLPINVGFGMVHNLMLELIQTVI